MDKLPLEIKEQIVGRTIWAPGPNGPHSEKWEDGPLKLELAEFHPLPHYLAARGENKTKTTDAEKALAALMRTSKEFKRICDRFTRELLCARADLEQRCECYHQPCSPEWDHDCPKIAERWVCTILGSQASMHTRVLNVFDDRAAWENPYYCGWLEPGATQLESLRSCTGLASLSLSGQTLAWLLPILDALPGGGAALKQLKASYPEVPEDPSDAQLDRILKAISHCVQLDFLDIDHAWQDLHPDESKATVFALRAVACLPRLSYLRLSSFGEDDLRSSLGGKTAAQVARALRVPVSRLSIVDTDFELDLLLGIVEACHETLEYVHLDGNYYFVTTSVEESLVTATFPLLRYIAVRGFHSDFRGDAMDLGPSVLPAHWRLPALEHLEAEQVDVGGQEGIDTFTCRLLSWKALRFLRIKGRWNEAGRGSIHDEEDKDPRRRWASRLRAGLRAKGVETHLYLPMRAE